MSDNYVGGLTSWGGVAALQQAAEAANAVPELAECGHTVDETGQIVLEGQEGQVAGFGNRAASAVPNLVVEHVQTPVTKRGLPSTLTTNPLGAARSRGQR